MAEFLSSPSPSADSRTFNPILPPSRPPNSFNPKKRRLSLADSSHPTPGLPGDHSSKSFIPQKRRLLPSKASDTSSGESDSQPDPIATFFSSTDNLSSLLENAGDFSTLFALVTTSRSTLDAFSTWPQHFIGRALASLPSEIRQIAIALVAYDEVYTFDKSLDSFREEYLGDEKRPLPQEIVNPLGCLSNLAAISGAVGELTTAFAQYCIGNIPAYRAKMVYCMKARIDCSWSASAYYSMLQNIHRRSGQPLEDDASFVNLPKAAKQDWRFLLRASETHRIQRAFWRLAIYLSVFRDTLVCNYSHASCHESTGLIDDHGYRHCNFLASLQPWELEEFATIHQYIPQMLDHTHSDERATMSQDQVERAKPFGGLSKGYVPEEIDEYAEWCADNEYALLIDSLMSAGLPQLYRVYCQKLKGKGNIAFERHSRIKMTNNLPSGVVQRHRRGDIGIARELFTTEALREWADSPGCHLPSLGLQSVGWHSSHNKYGSQIGQEMRGIGFPFWDR